MAGRSPGTASSPGYSEAEIARLPAVIGTEEAARVLRVSKRALREAAARGEVPSAKVLGAYRFRRDDVLGLAGLDYDEVVASAIRRAAAHRELEAVGISLADEDAARVRAIISLIRPRASTRDGDGR